MDCFGTYSTHVQTCDVTRVQSATELTASVHTSHMSRPVIGYYRTERKNALGHKPSHWCDTEQDNGWLRWKNETPARPYGTMDRCYFIDLYKSYMIIIVTLRILSFFHNYY